MLSGYAALPADSVGRGADRPVLTSWVLSTAQQELLSRNFITVRMRASRPTSLRVAVEAKSRADGRLRVTFWKTLRFSRRGVRTVHLRRTAESQLSLGSCRWRWLVPAVVLRSSGAQRHRTRTLARQLSLDPASCARSNPAAPWLPSARKPAIFDLGHWIPYGPRLDEALDQVAESGADTVRFVIDWRSIAPAVPPDGFSPTDPADPGYDFSAIDRQMQAAAARGLRVLLTIGGPAPDWGSSTGEALAYPRPREFGAFALAVARRYNGAFTPLGELEPLPPADLWSVWNEPNLDLFLRPQFRDHLPYSPILYRRLYLAAQSSIRLAAPGTPILIGETAPFGADGNVGPVDFVRGVLCLDDYARAAPTCSHGRIRAAGWAAHPYTQVGKSPFDTPNFAQYVVTIANLSNLEGTLDEAAGTGAIAPAFPVYITEFGFQSEPDPRGWPLQAQADFLSISEAIEYRDERVASTAQYLMDDDPPAQGGGYRGFESGLRFFDGTPKPSSDAFRLPLVVKRNGDLVSIWGLVRPARTVTAALVRVKDGEGPPRTLDRVLTAPSGVFTLHSAYEQDRLWRLVWRSPGGEIFRGPWTGSYEFAWPGG